MKKSTKDLIRKGITTFCPWYGEGKDLAYEDLSKNINPVCIITVDNISYIAVKTGNNPPYINLYLPSELNTIS